MKNVMWLIGLCISLISTTHAQPICTPNLTPEQAFLAITHPTATIQTTERLANLSKRININTASEAELTQLDGIGAKKAQDIILYREMIAPFATVDDLDKVKGIGKATIDKNRHKMTTQQQ